MNWSARGNVLNQYLRNTSIGTTVTSPPFTNTLSLQVMHKICCEAEAAIYHRQFFNDIRQLIENPPVGETIAMAAVDASFKQKCSAIICMSHTGT